MFLTLDFWLLLKYIPQKELLNNPRLCFLSTFLPFVITLNMYVLNMTKTEAHPRWDVQYSSHISACSPLQSISLAGAVNWTLKQAVYFLLESRLLQWIQQWACSRCAFVMGTRSVHYCVSEWRCGRLIYVWNSCGFQSSLSDFSYPTR